MAKYMVVKYLVQQLAESSSNLLAVDICNVISLLIIVSISIDTVSVRRATAPSISGFASLGNDIVAITYIHPPLTKRSARGCDVCHMVSNENHESHTIRDN